MSTHKQYLKTQDRWGYQRSKYRQRKTESWSTPEFRVWKNEKKPIKQTEQVVDEAGKKTVDATGTWAETRKEGRWVRQWFPNTSKN